MRRRMKYLQKMYSIRISLERNEQYELISDSVIQVENYFSIFHNSHSTRLYYVYKYSICHFISDACAYRASLQRATFIVKQHFSHFKIVWTALCVVVWRVCIHTIRRFQSNCRNLYGVRHTHSKRHSYLMLCDVQFQFIRCPSCTYSPATHKTKNEYEFIFIAKIVVCALIDLDDSVLQHLTIVSTRQSGSNWLDARESSEMYSKIELK